MTSAIQDLTIIIHFFIPLILERGEYMLYAAEIFEVLLLKFLNLQKFF